MVGLSTRLAYFLRVLARQVQAELKKFRMKQQNKMIEQQG